MRGMYRTAFDRISGDLSQKVDALASEPKNLPDARVEPRESTPPAPPTPIKVTTKRARVRALSSLIICIINSVYQNPLYEDSDYTRVRPSR